jgi:hypothetical protein
MHHTLRMMSQRKALGKPTYYSSNKIRKTQDEHLIIGCQNLKGHYIVVNLKSTFYFFGVYSSWFFIYRNYKSKLTYPLMANI